MTTATLDTTAASSNSALSNKGLALGAFAGAAAGAVLNVALYLVGSAAGVSYVAELQPGVTSALPLAQVAIASIVPAIPAILFALVLNRFTPKAALVFTAVAVGFGLLSMGGPATLGGASVGLKIVLALMHVFSGVGITVGLLRGGRRAST